MAESGGELPKFKVARDFVVYDPRNPEASRGEVGLSFQIIKDRINSSFGFPLKPESVKSVEVRNQHFHETLLEGAQGGIYDPKSRKVKVYSWGSSGKKDEGHQLGTFAHEVGHALLFQILRDQGSGRTWWDPRRLNEVANIHPHVNESFAEYVSILCSAGLPGAQTEAGFRQYFNPNHRLFDRVGTWIPDKHDWDYDQFRKDAALLYFIHQTYGTDALLGAVETGVTTMDPDAFKFGGFLLQTARYNFGQFQKEFKEKTGLTFEQLNKEAKDFYYNSPNYQRDTQGGRFDF